MSFTIRLSQDLTAVEAGATVPLSIDVTNKAEEDDRFEMQVEGIDPEWTAIPEPTFIVGPHEIHSQKIFLKPPRASESLSGNYPFVVRVRSLNSGDARTAQGVLQIKPFHHLSMEINPKKGYFSPMRRQNTFSLTLMNLGNTEHTLQLSGADPDEECTYEFANDQITIGPGHQKEVEVTVNTGRPGLIASSHLFGFAITARSIQNPNILATTQGQLERRPLLTIGSLSVIVLILAIFLGWIAVRPQPPSISVSVDNSTVMQGQAVHFHWRADHATSVKLEIRKSVNGKIMQPLVEDNLEVEGTKEILPTNEDTITVTAFAVAENRTTPARPVTISVQVPPVATPPKVLSFKASSTKVKLGEPVTFTFDYTDDVAKLVISPLTATEILPPAKKFQFTPTQIGFTEYQLIAYGKNNSHAEAQPIQIEVYQASDARILSFEANPSTIMAPDTKTTVSWNVSNATLVQLDDGTGSGLKTVEPTGTMDVITDKPVTLKLIATDAKNVATSSKLPIKYKPLPPPPTLAPGQTTGATTTTGSTAGTTGNTGTTTGGGQ